MRRRQRTATGKDLSHEGARAASAGVDLELHPGGILLGQVVIMAALVATMIAVAIAVHSINCDQLNRL